MRVTAALLLALAASFVPLAAVEEAQVLAAARAASVEYRNRYAKLMEGLSAPAEADRIATVRTIGMLRDPQSVPVLTTWMMDAHRTPSEQVAAVTVLGRLGYRTPVGQIRNLTRSTEPEVRKAAISALAQIQAIAAGDLMGRSTDEEDMLRLHALAGLSHQTQAEAAGALIAGLSHENALIRQAACIGLGRLGDRANGEKLKIALTDADAMVRRYAAEALVRLDYKPALPDLLMALEGGTAAEFILVCVRIMTGEDFGYDPQAPLLRRQEAMDRAITWLSHHPEYKN
jgi:HEAT repeat protein